MSKITLETNKKVCENKDICNTIVTSEDTKILECKSDEVSFTIYGYLECLIEKIDGCKNNPKNSSLTKIGEHILSSFSVFAIS